MFLNVYLAFSANLPTRLYILPSVISSSLFFYYEQSYLSISRLVLRLARWFLARDVIYTSRAYATMSASDFHDFFSPNGRYLREFSWSGPVFPISQGLLPLQPIFWQNCVPKLPTPLHLSLCHSEMERDIALIAQIMPLYCVNIRYSNSRENGAHSWTFCTTWQKTGIFSRMSQDILDLIVQSFHYMKGLWVGKRIAVCATSTAPLYDRW